MIVTKLTLILVKHIENKNKKKIGNYNDIVICYITDIILYRFISKLNENCVLVSDTAIHSVNLEREIKSDVGLRYVFRKLVM